MDCRLIEKEELIEKYVAQRLDTAAQDEIDLHILACDDCAQRLEVLHAIHANLTERAHEIRTQIPARPLLWRWQILTATALLLIAVGAVTVVRLQLRKSRHVAAGIALSSTADSNSTTAEAPPPQNGKIVPAQSPELSAPAPNRSVSDQQHVSPNAFGAQPSGAPPAANPQIADVPPSPPVDSTPPSGGEADRSSARDQSAGQTALHAKLTTAQGVEWYRLGAVEAPPYTFSGLAGGGNSPGSGNASSYSSRRDPADAGRVQFQAAMRAYVDGRYAEAVEGLAAALHSDPNAPDVNFYLGICDLLTGQPEKSIEPLQLATAGNSPLVQSAHYYLAKAYIEDGQLTEAETELSRAIAVPGRLTSESRALLLRLGDFRKEIENE
jgi:TolA-binding protein